MLCGVVNKGLHLVGKCKTRIAVLDLQSMGCVVERAEATALYDVLTISCKRR